MLDLLQFKESTYYQIVHEQGEADGQLEEARVFLVRVCRKRLGEPSEVILQRLGAIKDVEVIHNMADRLQEIESWEELIPADA